MTTDITAILAQRAELKRRDPEAILMFRVEDEHGDFYRAYGEDARDLVPIIGDAFSASDGVEFHHHGTPRDWTCIAPHALDRLLARIVAAGKRAAVCEQVECSDPRHEGDKPCPTCGMWSRGPLARVRVEKIQLAGSGVRCPACRGRMMDLDCDRFRCLECDYQGRYVRDIQDWHPGPDDDAPTPAGAQVERVVTPGAIETPHGDDRCPACGGPAEPVFFDRYRCGRCRYEGRNKDRHLVRRPGPSGPSSAAALIARARTNAYQLAVNRRATVAERDLARLLFDLADAIEAGEAAGGAP